MAKVEIEIRGSQPADRPAETRVLEDGRYTIGREAGDIVLGDPRVSSRHGELEVSAGRVQYRDLGSTNGSFFEDGTPVQQPVELGVGQALKLGSATLRLLSLGEEPAEPKAAPKGIQQRTMVMGSHMAGPPPQPVQEAPPSEPQASSPFPQPPQEPPSQAAPARAARPHVASAAGSVTADEKSAQPAPASGQGIWDEPEPAQAESRAGPAGGAHAIAFPTHVHEAGSGFVDEMKERLQSTWEIYEPHLQPMALLVGAVTVPFGLLSTLTSVLPFLNLVFFPFFILEALLMWLFVQGAAADYALRVVLGERYSPGDAAAAQTQRLLPWGLTMLITGILAFIGFLLFIVPALMVSWAAVPAYFVENKRMHEASTRSFELFTASWKRVLYGLAPIMLVSLAVAVATGILEAIPVIGILGPLVGAVLQAVLLPYSLIYLFRLYLEVRCAAEGNEDAIREARNAIA